MAESLWGAEFDIEDTPQQVKKIVSKIAKPKKIDWSLPAEKLIKSKNTTIEQKLQIINNNTLRILGVYKDNTLVIRSKEQLVDYIDQAIENNALAIDTETNMSLDPLTCTLMGPCIYTPGLKQAYIPLNHVNYQTGERLPNQLTEQDIKKHCCIQLNGFQMPRRVRIVPEISRNAMGKYQYAQETDKWKLK